MKYAKKPLFRPGWLHHLAPAALSVVTVFVLGSVRADEIPQPSFELSDKVGHFLAFAFVQLTHVRALEFIAEPKKDRRQVTLSVVSASIVGGLLELWQALLPHRTAEWGDFLADSLGAALAGLFYALLTRRTRAAEKG